MRIGASGPAEEGSQTETRYLKTRVGKQVVIRNTSGFCSVSKKRHQREEDVTVCERDKEPKEHGDDEWDTR